MDMVKNRPERPSYVNDRLAYADPSVRHFDPALPKFPQEEEYTISATEPYLVRVN